MECWKRKRWSVGEFAVAAKYLILYVRIIDLTLFFPMFPFDPPENIRKPLVF